MKGDLKLTEIARVKPTGTVRLYGKLKGKSEEESELLYMGRHELEHGRDDVEEIIVVTEGVEE